MIADSLGAVGACPLFWIAATWPAVIIPPIIVCCQLSLEAIKAPVPSCSSNVGSASTSGTPYCVSPGPMAHTMTLFGPVPSIMNPPIITLFPVCTNPPRTDVAQRSALTDNCCYRSGALVTGVRGVAGIGVDDHHLGHVTADYLARFRYQA